MSIIDFLFPKFCLGCGCPGTYICTDCRKRIIPFEKSRCLYCNKSSYIGLTHPSCCKRLNIDGITIIFQYNPFMRKVVKSIKYRLAREVFRELTININPSHLESLLKMKRVYGKALIQPIPLEKSRFLKRGFNQSVLIARFFSRILGLKVADYLKRSAPSDPQAELKSRSRRYGNIRGVFTLRPDSSLDNKTFVLVDDVVTTGATVREAARVLKKNGAKRVYVLSLCR